ncbi:hypothetical protein [Thalassovita aquimarina]|uniref:Uncharacterized protein n=1 Tax=Thalassovita aquimarina TaxID=2785917 RepID=A0ABS5HUK2_9RHOB|nr:hypothetical protein [Thalassovita aquimarina]MBR9652248.1 hypothetical protein [Thalassovita aquimarina]
MKAEDFDRWMKATETRYAADLTRKLGLSRNLAQRLLVDVKEGKDIKLKKRFFWQ